MSSTHRPAKDPAEPARSAYDGASTSAGANWARSGTARPRKVVPLRLSSAPQAAPTPAGPAVRVSGPDLLAQDAVFRQLLSVTSDPLAVQPMRDPVGLALGVVARLIVAACAAAVVSMLLIGVIPLPSRVAVPAQRETAAALPAAAPGANMGVAARLNANTTISERSALAPTVNDPSPARDAAAPVATAAPVRVATVSVHAGLSEDSGPTALDPDEVARLVTRGEAALAQGDIAAARLILRRAAEAKDARAALSVGATFDPAVLRQLRVVGFRPDIVQARAWYERAAAYGSAEAAGRLAALPHVAQ